MWMMRRVMRKMHWCWMKDNTDLPFDCKQDWQHSNSPVRMVWNKMRPMNVDCIDMQHQRPLLRLQLPLNSLDEDGKHGDDEHH